MNESRKAGGKDEEGGKEKLKDIISKDCEKK
jgi:hypothetical protein